MRKDKYNGSSSKGRNDIVDVIWNMIGGGLVACQSAILLFFIARHYNQGMAGIVSLAYAIAILTYTVAKYGIRNFQVTDQNEKYNFSEYFVFRVLTVIAALVYFLIYLICRYFLKKCLVLEEIIILEIVILRVINSIEDVFLGRFQQVGYFGIGAKISAIREIVLLLFMIVLIMCNIHLEFVLCGGILLSSLLLFILLKRYYIFLHYDIIQFKRINIFNIYSISKECFPLCISSSLAIYIGNIPKYTIDFYLNDYSQAIFSYLMLPVFTITLFNQFVYQPFIKELADAWIEHNNRDFIRKICKQSLLVVLSFLIIFILSFIWGIPLLSKIYLINLVPYKKEFVTLLIGGGLFALEYYLSIPIITMRFQKYLAGGYIFVILISFIIQKNLVWSYSIEGASLLYIITNALLTFFFICVVYKGVRKHGR